jgi:hypothetical protein
LKSHLLQKRLNHPFFQIVRSVFAEWQTSQAVAHLLKRGKGLPSLSPPFFSNQHDREINCEKFCQFLKDEIPLTVLAQLRTDPCIVLNRNAMNEIAAGGLDIWDTEKPADQNTHLYRRQALRAYAAHSSTHHNDGCQAWRPYGLGWQE